MTDAVAKLATALDTFDRLKHNFQSPGQVEKALNSITALEERLLLLRGSDSDIVERLSPYDQVKGECCPGQGMSYLSSSILPPDARSGQGELCSVSQFAY